MTDMLVGKNCLGCDTTLIKGKNIYDSQINNRNYVCKKCHLERCNVSNPLHNPKNNPNRMYVNGKYVPKTHPLYKAGNYKSFNDAAFSSFEKYKKSKDGYVYAITNPAWEGWVKIGMAVDADDRCKSYQTSSPLRDYKLEHCTYFEDRRKAEQKAHEKAEEVADVCGAEWFKLPVEKAIAIIGDVE